jgi:hypothetical protein
MRIRHIVQAAAAAAVFISCTGCDWFAQQPENVERKAELAQARKARLLDACASSLTYDRLKELAFDEAIRIRNADPVNLDTLATHSVVRMEKPVVKSRDEELNVTVCSGRFILELPPGAEPGFGGDRRLAADVEYAAQAAADGSGLVYQMKGAEPIIYKLAAFDLRGPDYRPTMPTGDVRLAEAAPAAKPVLRESQTRPADRPNPPFPAAKPEPAPAKPSSARAESSSPAPATQPRRAAERASPSFNCRYARSRSEKSVCSDQGLAALDRSMSSLFYSALSDAGPRTRAELRRSRDRFLAYRDRCSGEACIADAYRGRMQEIRDIMRSAD